MSLKTILEQLRTLAKNAKLKEQYPDCYKLILVNKQDIEELIDLQAKAERLQLRVTTNLDKTIKYLKEVGIWQVS
ncbi:MAG: hypothetical protein JW967_04600 [Dehalococcoidales bacterium]|nr:hypothetical protein [Dehalococcoidales bacterium]